MFFFRVRNKWVLICVPVGFVVFVYFICQGPWPESTLAVFYVGKFR